jgi:hypothetical protein
MDKMPMNTAPVGKPSVKNIGQLKATGTLHVRSGHGTEYGQVSAPTTTMAKEGAKADQKGTFWTKDHHGTEYKACSSK